MFNPMCPIACAKHYAFLEECMAGLTCVKARKLAFEKLTPNEQGLWLYWKQWQ